MYSKEWTHKLHNYGVSIGCTERVMSGITKSIGYSIRRITRSYILLLKTHVVRQEYTHKNYHVAGPKCWPLVTVLIGVPKASAFFVKTVLPHHVPIFVAPIVLFRGYCRQKKITTIDMATPESRAADKT